VFIADDIASPIVVELEIIRIYKKSVEYANASGNTQDFKVRALEHALGLVEALFGRDLNVNKARERMIMEYKLIRMVSITEVCNGVCTAVGRDGVQV
jgi:hypothetical protein